jgi:hypothetical protein
VAFSNARRIPALLVIFCGLASATDLKIVASQHLGSGSQDSPPKHHHPLPP